MAQMSGHIGVDLSRFPPDQPLADMEIEAGSRGSLDVILQGTEAQGLTLGEAARRFATSELCPQIVGSPETVADQLQDLFEARACDGFILTPTLMPGMFEQFVRAVVPLLQARGAVPARLRRHDAAPALAGLIGLSNEIARPCRFGPGLGYGASATCRRCAVSVRARRA